LQFNLVCALDFIPSTINSVQIAGTLVGNIAAGQIADLIGRKPPFLHQFFLFSHLILSAIFQKVGKFSQLHDFSLAWAGVSF
jgi:hypothetical protein